MIGHTGTQMRVNGTTEKLFYALVCCTLDFDYTTANTIGISLSHSLVKKYKIDPVETRRYPMMIIGIRPRTASKWSSVFYHTRVSRV